MNHQGKLNFHINKSPDIKIQIWTPPQKNAESGFGSSFSSWSQGNLITLARMMMKWSWPSPKRPSKRTLHEVSKQFLFLKNGWIKNAAASCVGGLQLLVSWSSSIKRSKKTDLRSSNPYEILPSNWLQAGGNGVSSGTPFFALPKASHTVSIRSKGFESKRKQEFVWMVVDLKGN